MAPLIFGPNGRPLMVRDSDKPVIGECNVCRDRGEPTLFFEGEERAFNAHLLACSERHQESQRNELRHRFPALFDPDVAGDVELERWMRHNGAAIMRGDLKP